MKLLLNIYFLGFSFSKICWVVFGQKGKPICQKPLFGWFILGSKKAPTPLSPSRNFFLSPKNPNATLCLKPSPLSLSSRITSPSVAALLAEASVLLSRPSPTLLAWSVLFPLSFVRVLQRMLLLCCYHGCAVVAAPLWVVLLLLFWCVASLSPSPTRIFFLARVAATSATLCWWSNEIRKVLTPFLVLL